jgi:hypothetical protein
MPTERQAGLQPEPQPAENPAENLDQVQSLSQPQHQPNDIEVIQPQVGQPLKVWQAWSTTRQTAASALFQSHATGQKAVHHAGGVVGMEAAGAWPKLGIAPSSGLEQLLAQSNPAAPASTTPVQTTPAPTSTCDPELGCVQVPDAGCFPDPELGCIRLKDPFVPPVVARKGPTVFLQGKLDYSRNTNTFVGTDSVQDASFSPGLGINTIRPLDQDTFLSAAADFGWVRYDRRTDENYNDLQLKAGVIRRLSPNMFAEVGWSHRRSWVASDRSLRGPVGEAYANDHGVRLDIYRQDIISPRLTLNTFYELKAIASTPVRQSRWSSIAFASLTYDLQPKVKLGLEYLWLYTDYTNQSRLDHYHQVLGRLIYRMNPRTQFNLFAGQSFGRSDDPTVDFNNFLFGVSFSTSVALF